MSLTKCWYNEFGIVYYAIQKENALEVRLAVLIEHTMREDHTAMRYLCYMLKCPCVIEEIFVSIGGGDRGTTD